MESMSHTDPLLSRAHELLLKHLRPHGPQLYLKPPGSESPPLAGSAFWHPWYPENQRLRHNGWKECSEENDEQQNWPVVVVYGGKHKQENYDLVEAGLSRLTKDGCLYFLVPNEYGSKSYQKVFERDHHLESYESGRKSRLYLLKSRGESDPLALVRLQRAQNGFFSTPGLFSWDKIDLGSEILGDLLEQSTLKGPVVDLGGGWGYLASRIPESLELHILEADVRGVKSCLRNVPRAKTHWCDVTDARTIPNSTVRGFATAVCNPPFHTAKRAEPELGQAFVETAHRLLRQGGIFYLVGNNHLPYLKVVTRYFGDGDIVYSGQGFQVVKASKK